MKPQTIQIFLPEGAPTSVKEAELTNRLIKAIWFPRTVIDKVKIQQSNWGKLKKPGILTNG